ncbi:MAG: inosine/xanthosine triphosphatase [Patescibacteria group bacterium]
MKKVVVASTNPVKLRAVAEAFARMFPEATYGVEGISVSSGVSDQPTSDAETKAGAWNRACRAADTAAGDFWVGIEGGVEEHAEGMVAFAWVVVRSADGRIGRGRTGAFFLPPQVAGLIRDGKELGDADDIVFGRVNSKQENGAVGILTDNAVDRQSHYEKAVIMALIPFKNEQLYFS